MLLLVLLSIVAFAQGTTWTEPVNTTQGLVRGILAEDGDYYMYLGVPYAKVNEENPFGAPDPHPAFDGVFDAVDDIVTCPQQEEYNLTIVGTLDCLNLNIFVPNRTSIDTRLPVIVYIYGGAFMYGFSRRFLYGPKFLVEHDVILVVMNYRVGPYGFMCLDTEDVPGNQGFKDQYLALKWINENIDAFGGDVNRITIMGNSAGSMSIDFHLMSDLPNLYNQAILQSGSALTATMITQPDNTVPIKIAEHLGFTTSDIQDAISFLANTHTDLVIAATLELQMNFRPCVEKHFDNIEPFIEMHPHHKNATDIDNIKILAGYNSDEVLVFPIFESMFNNIIMQDFHIDDMDTMINKARRFYIGDEMINVLEMNPNLIEFVADFIFNYPMQRSVVKYINGGAELYHYLFSYDGGRNYVKIRNNITGGGAMHADELGYLFDMDLFPATPTAEDQLIIDRMTTMWTNFAKFGNPTPAPSQLLPVTWSPATRDVMPYLDINSELTTGTRPFHARLSFWDLFYAANQDKLLANIYYSAPSSSARFSSSLVHVLLYGFTIYLLQL